MVPFITWGLMAYRLLGEVVPDLAKINIIGGFFGRWVEWLMPPYPFLCLGEGGCRAPECAHTSD